MYEVSKMGEMETVKPRATLKQCASAKMSGETPMDQKKDSSNDWSNRRVE